MTYIVAIFFVSAVLCGWSNPALRDWYERPHFRVVWCVGYALQWLSVIAAVCWLVVKFAL